METLSSSSGYDYQPIANLYLSKSDKYKFFSLATDILGNNIAIGSEKSLFIVDSNDNLYLWDVNEEKLIGQFLNVHIRHISSLDWNKSDSNLIASSSGDGFIKIWDTRNLSKQQLPQSSINSRSNISQLCWNPISPSMIASSNEGEVKIWDIRKFGSPLITFSAHLSSISSIDWSSKNCIVTCGSDRLVKVWDPSRPNQTIKTYQTGSPCKLAKFVPFVDNHSVASISQKGYNEISFWSGDLDSSSLVLTGHQNSIISFDWRVSKSNDDPNNYLVSIGKDNYLRMWNFTKEMINNLNSTDQDNENNLGNQTPRLLAPPLDLHQELKRVKTTERFLNLSIEKVCENERLCIVSVDNRKFVIIISFPFLYPSASPSFDIVLNDVSYSYLNIKAKLKKKLDEFSYQLLETKKPFLIQLLSSLSEYYQSNKEFFSDITTTVDSPQIQQRLPKNILNQPSTMRKPSPMLSGTSISAPTTPTKENNGTNSDFSPIIHSQSNDSPGKNNNTIINILGGSVGTNIEVVDVTGSSALLPPLPSIVPIITTSPGLLPLPSTINVPSDDKSLRPTTTNRTRSISASNPPRPDDFTKSRSVSIGSTHHHPGVPPPPSIPYNNGNQTVLFEMYVVKPTDTLTGISLQYSMPRDVLIQTNRLLSDKLIPGTILWVYKKKLPLSPKISTIDENSTSGEPNGDNNTNGNNSDQQQIEQQQKKEDEQNQVKVFSFLKARPNRSNSHSPTVNINNLFKPLKEEVEMAFQQTNSKDQKFYRHHRLHQHQQDLMVPDRYIWGGHRRFDQIPKENILKENLVCFMKDKKVFGTLTLTPYQLIFQSIDNISTQILADYPQIVSCKYFPNKTEWISHLSKDWNKEQYFIKKSKKNNKEIELHDKFIQGEIAKLNEMEEELTTIPTTTNTKEGTQQHQKVLVFPCIYVLIHKDKHIQTLFFRGVDANGVQSCFSYLKKLVVDSKFSSPQTTSPVLSSASSKTSSTSNPIEIPILNVDTGPISNDCSFEDDYSPSPKLLKELHHKEQIILTTEIFKRLRHYLPMRVQGSDIVLRFNTTNDGVSFSTFYRKMKEFEQSLLLIKDQKGYIFGAYLSEEIKSKKDTFYGTGETLLFKIHPEFEVFGWTKENDFFIFTNQDYIAIGGGSMFGLWMDNDFLHGYSGKCETFNNSCLSSQPDFTPVVVEFWAIK
eukprot:gene1161-1471_t